MIQLTVTVDNLLSVSKAAPAALTDGIGQSIRHVVAHVEITKLFVDFHVTPSSL